MALDAQVVEYLGIDYHEEEQRNTLTFTGFLKLPPHGIGVHSIHPSAAQSFQLLNLFEW